jgi:hypothetical protein
MSSYRSGQCMSSIWTRVARFFLVHDTKT